jgi:Bacterial pre-peptidase C-terminal domain
MTVYDLGTIDNNTAKFRLNETVTNAAPDDIYKFKTLNSRSLNVMISDLQGGDADLQLYRDTNGNGVLNIGTDQLMQSSDDFGTNDDIINRWRGAGTYFARVFQFSGSPITYDIHVSATKQSSGNLTGPPNLLAKEETFSPPFPGEELWYSGSVGVNSVDTIFPVDDFDTSDLYYFTLGAGEQINIRLDSIDNNADVRLIQDLDSSRTAGAGETIAISNNTGTSQQWDDTIWWATPGNYYIQVYTPGLANTRYDLQLTTVPI